MVQRMLETVQRIRGEVMHLGILLVGLLRMASTADRYWMTLCVSCQVWGGIGEKTRYNDTHILKSEDENPFWQKVEPEVFFSHSWFPRVSSFGIRTGCD